MASSESALTVTVVDCHYVQKEFAATYILESKGEWALLDTNTENAVPWIDAEIQRRGLHPEKMKYLIVTHVHLDHAAATGYWAHRFPKAQILCHSRAERHLADPAKLVASARAVYGDEAFTKLYAQIQAVPSEQIRCKKTGDHVQLGSETLEFIETPGHAKHHVCIFGRESRFLFSGDMGGVSYPQLRSHGLFMIPSTSPTDYNAKDALESLRVLADLHPVAVFPTHFGRIDEASTLFSEMRAHYEFTARVVSEMQTLRTPQPHLTGAALVEVIHARWMEHIHAWAKSRGFQWSPAQMELLELDLKLNAQGMAWAIENT